MKKLPQFLYSKVNMKSDTKILISTKFLIFWEVINFKNNKEKEEYILSNETNYLLFSHKKYPYCITCIDVKSDVSSEKIKSISNRVLDWYFQFWIEEER